MPSVRRLDGRRALRRREVRVAIKTVKNNARESLRAAARRRNTGTTTQSSSVRLSITTVGSQ
jgi:hypothetical protein